MDSEALVSSRRRRVDMLILVGLLTIALVWRLVYFFEMQASPYADHLTLDSQVYHEIALAVADGRFSNGTTFFQAPLYPLLLGVVYSVFGPSQSVAKLLQILLGVASCWLIYRICERVFDRTVARVALAIAAVYGMFLYFANELLVVTLVVFLDLLGLELVLRACGENRKALWAAAGVVFGLSAIARPTILPFVGMLAACGAMARWRSRGVRAALLETVVFGAGVAVPIAPVTLHNYLADGDLVLVAANGGVNFFIGNNPGSDGVTAVVPGTRPDRRGAHADQVRIAREALGDPQATPREISDYWYDRAWRYIRDAPGAALVHTAFKAYVLVNAHEVSNSRVIGFVTGHSSIFSRATLGFWLVLPLAVAGVIVGGGRRLPKYLLVVYVVVSSATVVPFFITARFRMPIVPILIIFAAAAVVAWSRRLLERPLEWRSTLPIAASAAVALLAALLIRPMPALRVPDAQAFFNEAEAYRARGEYGAAAEWYAAALDEHPSYCDAAFNLARIHLEIDGDPQRAIEVLEPAIESCAADPGIRRLLGGALCAVGRCEEGAEHLRAAGARPAGSKPGRRETSAVDAVTVSQ